MDAQSNGSSTTPTIGAVRSPRYMTLARAAELLHRDPETLRGWIRKGVFTGLRLPGARGVCVDFHEVEEGLRKAGIDPRQRYADYGGRVKDLRRVAGTFEIEGA